LYNEEKEWGRGKDDEEVVERCCVVEGKREREKEGKGVCIQCDKSKWKAGKGFSSIRGNGCHPRSRTKKRRPQYA